MWREVGKGLRNRQFEADLIQWTSPWRDWNRQHTLLTVLICQLLSHPARQTPKTIITIHQQVETLETVTLFHKEVQLVLKALLQLWDKPITCDVALGYGRQAHLLIPHSAASWVALETAVAACE